MRSDEEKDVCFKVLYYILLCKRSIARRIFYFQGCVLLEVFVHILRVPGA